jgi:hypothetical protein
MRMNIDELYGFEFVAHCPTNLIACKGPGSVAHPSLP